MQHAFSHCLIFNIDFRDDTKDVHMRMEKLFAEIDARITIGRAVWGSDYALGSSKFQSPLHGDYCLLKAARGGILGNKCLWILL